MRRSSRRRRRWVTHASSLERYAFGQTMTPYHTITFGEMRASGVRDVLIYCRDHRCSHHVEISADRWPDHVRLSDSRRQPALHRSQGPSHRRRVCKEERRHRLGRKPQLQRREPVHRAHRDRGSCYLLGRGGGGTMMYAILGFAAVFVGALFCAGGRRPYLLRL